MCVVRVTCVSVMSFLCEDKNVCCKSYVCQCHVFPLQGKQGVLQELRVSESCLSSARRTSCVVRAACVKVLSFLCEDNKVCCKSYVCQSHVFPLRGQECVW